MEVTLVATDQNQDYNYLRRGIHHEAVNHSQGEYVRGNVHTNSIESFWSSPSDDDNLDLSGL